MWQKITDVKQIPHKTVIAYDAVHQIVGIYDNGGYFSSLTGDYCFDSGADNMLVRGNIFLGYDKRKAVGKITHWMPIPGKPKK